jgi:transcriptional regulator with XRE-family HTH domain
MATTKTLGQRLRQLRRERGLTQYELADLSGWHQSTISHLELDRVPRGSRAIPDLAAALGVSEAFLRGLK